jgi:hypothetical protein
VAGRSLFQQRLSDFRHASAGVGSTKDESAQALGAKETKPVSNCFQRYGAWTAARFRPDANRSLSAGATVHDSSPNIRVDFKSKISPGEVTLTIDGTDVTALLQISDTSVELEAVAPFSNGEHQITITVNGDTDSWRFKVERQQNTPGLTNPESDAEVPLPSTTPLSA